MPVVRVWDLPTRLFHWLLLACVVGLVVTANVGGAWMQWHLRLGYTVLTLLLFRLVWGFVGGHWSRFAHFVPTPSRLIRYLRPAGDSGRTVWVGHNPLGALSVLAMLGVLLLQVGSGLFADDEISFFGPLVPLVSSDTVGLATWYHKAVGKPLLIGLIVLHVLAIAYHRWVRRERLVQTMLTGDLAVTEAVVGSKDHTPQRLGALGVFALCAAVVYALVQWGYGSGG